MNYVKQVIAIVDPYNSGALLAPEFASRGYACVHVQSRLQIPAVFSPSYQQENFVATVRHGGDIEATLAKLGAYRPCCVVAGMESGVELADEISERLGLLTNGTALSAARRDKYLMNEAVRRAGLRTVRQFRSGAMAPVIEWVRTKCDFPVVVKPINSAGTDGVSMCSSVAELSTAFQALQGKLNRLELINSEVLVQEFLVGTEYVVDTVSCQGTHYVTDFWRYNKGPCNGASFMYYSMEILPFEGQIQEELQYYTFQVLDALQIRNGPAHSEVMMTSNGPVLIEVGARLHGSNGPTVSGIDPLNA